MDDAHAMQPADLARPHAGSRIVLTASSYLNQEDGTPSHHQESSGPSYQSRDDSPPSPKRCKMAHSHRDDVTDATSTTTDITEASRVRWPPAKVPVEIFQLITSYLTRPEVKALRLVCREFENKVSAQYFKNVVVPFRSELYNTLSRHESGTLQHLSSALFPSGMRIFESFGPHILRFALSLELDEDALAHPPIKPSQELVPAFWGVYRWPHATYNRYSDLEGIEQTADETQGMRWALRCLTKVVNLGLCCDAGLGFLVRPDDVARNAATQQRVFSTQDWRRERRPMLDDDNTGDPIVTVADFNGLARLRSKGSADSLQFKRTVLEQMANDAGYRGTRADEAIQTLLDTEGVNLADIDFDGRPLVSARSGHQGGNNEGRMATIDLGPVSHFNIHTRVSSALDTTKDPRSPPLRPNELTQAQKELLLELDWAHRAMIQSYVIAMIDNASDGCFHNLTTLTIAKIPSSHLHTLYRSDFWKGFPNLANVSLGVIADWRRISNPAPGYVGEQAVSPVDAVPKVHKLLNSFIAKRSCIESLHFEWICGGEFAPSFFQRNQYILPAPFLEKAEDMASLGGAKVEEGQLLSLPHVKHLSLKNCWVSPHVFLQTIRQMGLASLKKLELESVSLSGRPTHQVQFLLPPPLGAGVSAFAPNPVAQQHPTGPQQIVAPIFAGTNANPVDVLTGLYTDDFDDGPPSPSSSPPATGVGSPDWFTWAGMLEHFSPGLNTRKHTGDQASGTAAEGSWESRLTSSCKYLPMASRLPKDEKEYEIGCLSLKSCGYVAIDCSTLNTRALFPGVPSRGTTGPNDAQSAIQNIMQQSKDKLLGRIIPFIAQEERALLTDAFGMVMGWSGIYSERIIEAAMADGVESPGAGRFSGVLESTEGDT